MNDGRLHTQIEQFDKAFHAFWRGVLFLGTQASFDTFKGLGFLDMQLIYIAQQRPDAILKEIRDYLKIPQTTLSSAIARLEKKGLLKRVINNRDMRSFSLEITDQGEQVLGEHKKNDYEQAKSILSFLDEDERDDFIRLMAKVAGKMEAII